jgi:hypothetical protein
MVTGGPQGDPVLIGVAFVVGVLLGWLFRAFAESGEDRS